MKQKKVISAVLAAALALSLAACQDGGGAGSAQDLQVSPP